MGMGSPGEKYQGTPHNVGKRVLDLLARSWEGKWIPEDQAMVAASSGRANLFISSSR